MYQLLLVITSLPNRQIISIVTKQSQSTFSDKSLTLTFTGRSWISSWRWCWWTLSTETGKLYSSWTGGRWWRIPFALSKLVLASAGRELIFFLLSFIVRPGTLRVLSALTWKIEMGSRIYPSQFREIVSDLLLLLHMDCEKARWDTSKGIVGAGEHDCQAAFCLFSAVLVNWGGPKWLETCQHDTHLQEGSEKGSGELQDFESDLGIGEGHGTDHFEWDHTTCVEESEDQAQPVCIHESHDWSCLTNLITFHDKVTLLEDERKAVDVVYF